MRPASAHILPLLLVLPCLLAGCARRGRVIPEEQFSRLYEEMLLADQWVREAPEARKKADTTLFFDPIFKRHGYTFADYDRSVNYYLDHPEKFIKILNDAAERLNKEQDRLQKQQDERIEAERERDRLHGLYKTDWDFADDSLSWARDRILWPVREASVDTLAAVTDSTAVADTLVLERTPLRDTESWREDPVIVRDSVRRPPRRVDKRPTKEMKILTQ